MTIEQDLQTRSDTKCELCGADNDLAVYTVPNSPEEGVVGSVLVCRTCLSQIEGDQDLDEHHWRCLNDSMWSQVPAVQVMAWRMLNRLQHESWAQDLLDMLYLEDDVLDWAKAGADNAEADNEVKHLDSNGAVLAAGDTVTLIKDLNVKGANFTAKRGTPVRNINLVADNPEQIEGRVNGQQIVILTQFVKKSK
ncbi:PhnA domain-containing protein [methane-oxidizing endosymbiont of Gigantopelta aegis]|uniref:PhnA domain-containing protein n=1 Tax=methane-oxidizing endosymbiont of Gigantopelta aegis TaxID=2794938 RepID=UPI0018DE244E|nr:alkylphosphonate utilization protein [methane-oxidizing endosymbiont of Gigantopelta aegis]